MSAAPRSAQPACRSMRAVTGPTGAPQGQATTGFAPGFASGPVDAEHSSGAPSDRRRSIEILADGSAWDHSTFRMWIDQLARRAPERVRVARLSDTDPVSQGIAAEISARSGR